MSILSRLTLLFNDKLVNCFCHVCGNRTSLLGLDFGIDEEPDQEPRFACHSCTENLRPDLVKIQKAAFEFARSGMVKDCIDTEEAVVGWASMPWMRGTTREQAAAPKTAAAPLMTDEEYLAEKNAHDYRVDCELLVRKLVESKIESEQSGRLEDLAAGDTDASRQGMSLKEIEMLEFHRDNYVISYSKEVPTGWLV